MTLALLVSPITLHYFALTLHQLLASPVSHTRPRFRLYALAKLNAGSPDTPTSKKMEKRGGRARHQRLTWRGVGEWSRGVEAVMEHHLRTVDRWSTRGTRYAHVLNMGVASGPVVLETCIPSLISCINVNVFCKDTCLTFTPSYGPLVIRSIFPSLALSPYCCRSHFPSCESSHPNFTSALMVGAHE